MEPEITFRIEKSPLFYPLVKNSINTFNSFAHYTFKLFLILYTSGARGSLVSWGTMLQSQKVTGSSPDEMDFFSIDLILAAALWP
jgi:hypothetical protein